jgi:glycyl-tRNA synthetase beta chain
MVGEFPELQGLIGGYLARAQGQPKAVADAIRDHYKPVGQGDEVPTAPVTVAVSLADKLDSLFQFYLIKEKPTGSKDPYALRRAALGVVALIVENHLRIRLDWLFEYLADLEQPYFDSGQWYERWNVDRAQLLNDHAWVEDEGEEFAEGFFFGLTTGNARDGVLQFLADRLKVQQREAGVRHDLIDAVFALGGEDDLVRLLARVRALQAFVETAEGKDLLAGYKRAANILKKEGYSPSHQAGEGFSLSYTPENEEAQLIAALDAAEPKAAAAVEAEDFEGAMAALASLRGPVDAFFDKVTVNDPDTAKREARLVLLARMRDAVHRVADFSRIEG